MKTIKFLGLILVTGLFTFTACQKDELEVVPMDSHQAEALKSSNPGIQVVVTNDWKDDFTSASSVANRWFLFGERAPQFIPYAFDRFGLLDNNGSLGSSSYAVSKTRIGNGSAMSLESSVYIDVTNPKGTVVCPEIGITRTMITSNNPDNLDAGISMKLVYMGKDVQGVPAQYQDQTYVVMSTLLEDGSLAQSGDYAFKVDNATNGWHTMNITINASHQIFFFLDGQLIWTPKKPVAASLLKNRNVLVGRYSPGNGGKAYHDFIKVTYPTPDQTVVIGATGSLER
ncbi:MAG: hypothetical protein HXX13_07680 [Bacteroidetes bacterium]|nr:hypothetical protein [Bacteroidota bacterium]